MEGREEEELKAEEEGEERKGKGAGPASPSPLGKESVYLPQRVLTDSPETNVEQKDESKAVSDLFQSRARRAGF